MGVGEDFSLLEANVWGMLFYATEIEQHHEYFNGMHVYSYLGHSLVFLRHAAEVLNELGHDGTLIITLRLDSIRGAQWVYAGMTPSSVAYGPSSVLDNDAEFSFETSVSDLLDKLDEVVRTLARFTFFSTNWVDAVTDKQMFENLLKTAYRYNGWHVR